MAMKDGSFPIILYNITDPTEPRVIKYLSGYGWPTRCRVIDGKWLWTYYANGENFFDISHPAKPKLFTLKKKEEEEEEEEVIVPPNVFYVRKISIEDWEPEFHGKKFIGHPYFSESTFVDSNIMYYGTRQNPKKLSSPAITEIYDINDPKNPKLLSTIEGEAGNLVGNILFTGSNIKPVIFIYDVSEPSSPKKLTEIKVEDFEELVRKGIKLGGAGSATYNDGKVYIGIKQPLKNLWGKLKIDNPNLYQSGIAIIDVGDFSSKPKLLSWYIIEGEVSDIGNLVYHKGHIFANDTLLGLRVFEVRNPRKIRQVAIDRQGGELSAVAYIPKKKILCIGKNGIGGFIFVDVSSPLFPQILSQISIVPFNIFGNMAVYKDRYLYAQGDFLEPKPGFSALFVIDLQNPKKPKLVNIVPGVLRSYGGVCVDNYLYLSSGEIFDISNPEKPKKLDVRLPCNGYQITYKKDIKPYLYIAAMGENGVLYVLDITERERPKLVGELPLIPKGHRFITTTFIGKYLVLGWGESVIAVDITEPKNPVIRGKWGEKEIGFKGLKQVWSDNRYLFVCGDGNLSIIRGRGNVKKLKEGEEIPQGWLITGEPEIIYRIGLGELRILKYDMKLIGK